VKTLLQDPALVARSKSFSADPPVKKPRPLSGMEPDAHYNFSFTKLENSELNRAFFNIQAGGANAPPAPPCAPPRNHILPPQEKSLFPKFIQTNQRRLTNT
jgi:hypothetical protein